MQKHIKLTFFAMFAGLFIAAVTPTMARANAFIDGETGNFVVITEDKKRTSSIWYKTYGFSITRCKYNPAEKKVHETGEYVLFNNEIRQDPHDETSSIMIGGIKLTNNFQMPIKDMLSRASGAWAEEVQKALDGTGPGVWIKFDSVMYIHHGSEIPCKGPYHNEGFLGNEIPGPPLNPAQIQAAESWSNPSGLATHYNQYIYIGKQEPVPGTPGEPGDPGDPDPRDDDWRIIDEGSNEKGLRETDLKFTTGNFCDEFNLDKGIPGGEAIRNESTASRWHGRTYYHAHTVSTKKYLDTPYYYEIRWPSGQNYPELNPDGSPHPHAGQPIMNVATLEGVVGDNGHGRVSLPKAVVPVVAYQYVWNPQFYDLTDMVVTNLAYPGTIKNETYTRTIKTEATCLVAPEKLGFTKLEDIAKKENSDFEIKDWYPLNSAHVSWAPTPGLSRDMLYDPNMTGREGLTEEEAKAIMADRLEDDILNKLMPYVEANTRTNNDRLEIDGNIFLDNKSVKGCDWLFKSVPGGTAPIYRAENWKKCISSSAVKAGFQKQDKQLHNPDVNKPNGLGDGEAKATIRIPEDMDNGKYPTAMEVIYSQMIRNCGLPFLASGDSALSCGESGCKIAPALYGGTSSSGAMGAYYDYHTVKGGASFKATDGIHAHINVHSPVIAPVIIKDSELEDIDNNKNQITPGNKSEKGYTMVNTKESGELGASYNKDLLKMQLLLDEDYVLDWEAAQQRTDAKNYGPSGSPSKYDKYVKKKWMRFPFDVVYDGHIYKAETIVGTETLNEGWDEEWELTTGMKYTPWIEIKAPVDSNGNIDWQKSAGTPAEIKGSAATAYVPVSKNHWRKTPIYIPSFADEVGGVYDLFNKGNTANIYYKVEAENVDGYYGGDHTKEQEKIFNGYYSFAYADDGAKYVATYKIPVQTSGQIYDFMITGTDDIDAYQYMNTGSHIVTGDVAFCKYKMDKRVGTKNRYGGTGVRYRADGQLIQDWKEINTLPLTRGKSASASGMGDLMRGTKISFSLKTIANLWDEDGGDFITITPTFRYIDKNGVVKDNIKLYYNTYSGSKVFVEYGKEGNVFTNGSKAQNVHTVQLNDPEFDNSYYTQESTTQGPAKDAKVTHTIDYQIGDWVRHTVNFINTYKEGKTPDQSSGLPLDYTPGKITKEAFMNNKVNSYNFSSIVLTKDLRMLSGEWEQLKRNTKGEGRAKTDLLPYYYFTYEQEDTAHPIDDGLNPGEAPYDDKTGQGSVHLKFEKITIDNFAEDKTLKDRFLYSMQTWFGQYYVPADLYIVDLDKAGKDFSLNDYIKEKGKDFGGAKDPIFTGDEGYLICNFDIRSVNDGHAHLSYYGEPAKAEDMWKKEGGQSKIELDGNEIPLKSGDVFVIDMGRKVRDKYSPGIFNIN